MIANPTPSTPTPSTHAPSSTPSASPATPASSLVLLFGGLCYLIFVVSFTYFVGFLENIGVPAGVDAGVDAGAGRTPSFSLGAFLLDLALLGLFAVQHSVMARPRFKALWTRVVPPPIERSVYVLLSSLLLFLLCWQWRPLTALVWRVDAPVLRDALVGISFLGWVLVILSSCLISHFDLFGLRQVYLAWQQKPYTDLPFRIATLYRLVRHPMMVGFLIAFWFTPLMTVGHLLLTLVFTAYILAAVRFLEERDLAARIGAPYRTYQRQVPMFIPRLRRG